MTVGLILSVLALIVSAIVWGFGSEQLQPALVRPRQDRRPSSPAEAAVICGASFTLINFFWDVGQAV